MVEENYLQINNFKLDVFVPFKHHKRSFYYKNNKNHNVLKCVGSEKFPVVKGLLMNYLKTSIFCKIFIF